MKKPKISVTRIKTVAQLKAAEQRIKDFKARVSAAEKAKSDKERDKKTIAAGKKRLQEQLNGLGRVSSKRRKR